MLYQNLKVAFRNLMKYKVQTLLSIASIAIGIVTLSLAFSVMTRFSLPSIMSQPFKNRAYEVHLLNAESNDTVQITGEILRAVKHDEGPRHAERIALLNNLTFYQDVEIHLVDSTTRKGYIGAQFFDPDYGFYLGLYSAITGEKMKKLRKGEAIISEKHAKELFQDSNPVGAILKIPDATSALLTISDYTSAFPFTIVDVYKELSVYDPLFHYGENSILFCKDDNVMEGGYFSPVKAYIVLTEGSTESELLDELNERLKPFNLEVRLSKVVDSKEMRKLIAIHLLVYILGSLLLLAAIIGFLRMQVQLFWMRRREISLRIVNGARRLQIFVLLSLEVSIIIGLSIVLSIVLGYLLEDFLGKNLGFFSSYHLIIRNLWHYSVEIGVILLLICGLIAWIIVLRIANTEKGLAVNMRRSRNHLFRNIMLSVQIAICITFVGLTFILINGGGKLLESYNVPENNAHYKDYIYIKGNSFSYWQRLVEDLEELPDLEKMVSCELTYHAIRKEDIRQNVIMGKLFYITDDPAMPSDLGIDIEWFKSNIDHNDCILIGEDYYSELQEEGLLANNTLSYFSFGIGGIEENIKPIGGIIKKMPYRDNTEFFMVINLPTNKYNNRGYILIPKRGHGKALARSVSETIENIEPGRIEFDGNRVMRNYRSFVTSNPDTVEVVTTLGWILGIVSVVICAMSILSTITLDTRSRRKEVAIRKVNGAKSIDIYRLFGRVYIVLLAFAIIVAIPVCVMFNGFVENYVKDHSTVEGFSPLWPIILAISIVAVLILAIVGWQTYKTLHMDPAKIIAKE